MLSQLAFNGRLLLLSFEYGFQFERSPKGFFTLVSEANTPRRVISRQLSTAAVSFRWKASLRLSEQALCLILPFGSLGNDAAGSLLSGLARTVTSGGKSLLQTIGVLGSNKRIVQIEYLKKVLHSLEHQAMLPQGEFYLDL